MNQPTPPSRRLHVYIDHMDPEAVEILLLGAADAIAQDHVVLQQKIRTWPGFREVHPIMMQDAVIGWRAKLSIRAVHADPIAETMSALRSFNLQWAEPAHRVGTVATW